MTTFARRTVAIVLLLCLFCQPLFALAQDSPSRVEEDPDELVSLADDPDALAAMVDQADSANEAVQYIATSTMALRVRSGPGTEYGDVHSIPEGAQVDILDLGEEWTKVRTRSAVGYVMTKYLKDVYHYDAGTGEVGEKVEITEEEPTSDTVRKYTATTAMAIRVRNAPAVEAEVVDSFPAGIQLYLVDVGEEWSKINNRGTSGYILTKYLKDIRHYDAATGAIGQRADVNATPTPSPQPEATPTPTAEPIRYIATVTANAPIKMRKFAQADSLGVDSIPSGTDIYVYDLGEEWSKVRNGTAVGYVPTKYLSNIREYDAATEMAGQAVATDTPAPTETVTPPQQTAEPQPVQEEEATQEPTPQPPEEPTATPVASEAEVEKYIATSGSALKVRKSPDADAEGIDTIAEGGSVYVIELGDEWSKVRCKGGVGYVMTKYLTNVSHYDAQTKTIGAAIASENEAPQLSEADKAFQASALPKTTIGEDGEPMEKYIATNSVTLNVRSGPGVSYGNVDVIQKDSIVYILDLGAEWSKVRTKYSTGYVQSQYLADIRDYNESIGITGEESGVPQTMFGMGSDVATFKHGFIAYAVKNAGMYAQPDERSQYVTKVPTYQEVIVSHIQGEWCYAKYGDKIGYIRTSGLFKWDRIDPYAGEIPGCTTYSYMAFVNKTANVYNYATVDKKKQEVLKTVVPGGAIAVTEPDEEGRYYTAYWRKDGYVNKEDIAYLQPVVDYREAQPGDLISAVTTYYAVGIHTLNYQGRNWNIYLATTMISGTVLQPGETFNINQIIGPYRQSTGYKPAPIASPTALWGYGGGTCQVSTTVYNALIQVPIYINHRRVHSNTGAKYVPKGFDAAVGGGDINLIATNALPYPVRFEFFMSDGTATMCIFRGEE